MNLSLLRVQALQIAGSHAQSGEKLLAERWFKIARHFAALRRLARA